MKAIVTGHTRGLGAAIAEELLARKFDVLGLSRHDHAELAARFPHTLRQIQLDLADTTALAEWLSSGALRQFAAGGKTVFLVNNAGTVQPVGPLRMQESANIARAVNLNVAAPMMLASALATVATEANDIRIVHVSSGAGRSAYAGWSVYCATKAALDQHARAAALDHAKGVRICSLAPGIIDTDMQAEIRASSLERFPMRPRFEGLKLDGQLTPPKECARQLVAFLLSAQFGREPVADLRTL